MLNLGVCQSAEPSRDPGGVMAGRARRKFSDSAQSPLSTRPEYPWTIGVSSFRVGSRPLSDTDDI